MHVVKIACETPDHLQPRPSPRSAATKPALPGAPVLVEHEYQRDGALNLFTAFDTRSGKVHAATFERKRQPVVNFASKAELAQRLLSFVQEWNERCHPLNWSTKSVAKVMAKCELGQAA